MRHLSCTLAVASLLIGCGLVEKHHLTGHYYLVAEDVPEQMKVIYNLEPGDRLSRHRIPETVFAVGWDRRYIVAKQHPQNNRSITNYYYLDTARDSEDADPTASIVGPLTEPAFSRKKVDLGLPDFRRTIKSLE
ncbi:MAG: DUF3997 domain-containing protein [Verrucomicrobiaceae bacterium]|nr:MAG: DUF3997 domain-containing protein [Verrucomicrobiaceae bacterium]